MAKRKMPHQTPLVMAGDRRTSSTGRFANRVACRPKEKTKTNEGPPGDGTTRMQVDSPEMRVERSEFRVQGS